MCVRAQVYTFAPAIAMYCIVYTMRVIINKAAHGIDNWTALIKSINYTFVKK